jgi:hypothetical protein
MNYCGTALQFQSLANPTNGLPTAGKQLRKGTVMTTTTPLDLSQGFFDSAETEILSMAFEKAWAFVEFDPMLGGLEASVKRSQLARCLMTLFKLGETDPTSLANSAIKMLRRNRQNGVRKRQAPISSAQAVEESRVVLISRG